MRILLNFDLRKNKVFPMKKTHLVLLLSLIISFPIIITSCTGDDDDDNSVVVPDDAFLDTRDGEIYKKVVIGDQTWMAENLRYKTGSGSYAYDDNEDNVKQYGRLYSFSAAKKACPDGWHLATEAEWQQLECTLGMDSTQATKSGYRGTNEADMLKKEGTTGFNIEYAGIRNYDGSYNSMTNTAEFWTATENMDGQTAWSREIQKINSKILKEFNQEGSALSCRCVKDPE